MPMAPRWRSGAATEVAGQNGRRAAIVGAGVYIRFLPWVVFCLVDRKGGLDIQWAAWSALATGLVIFCVQTRRRQNDFSYAGILSVFAALLIVHAASGPATAAFLETHGRAFMSIGVGLVLLVSVLSGHPACDTAARRAVPPWASRTFEFRQLVRRTVFGWAAAMFCLAGLFAGASTTTSPVGKTLFGWLGPLALCLVVVNIDAWSWRQFSASIALADDRSRSYAAAGARVSRFDAPLPESDEAEHVATVYSLSSASSLVREL
ncbi:MAG TPA: hypothetical protein VIY26_04745 [Acidimicrobiales bacterium]